MEWPNRPDRRRPRCPPGRLAGPCGVATRTLTSACLTFVDTLLAPLLRRQAQPLVSSSRGVTTNGCSPGNSADVDGGDHRRWRARRSRTDLAGWDSEPDDCGHES